MSAWCTHKGCIVKWDDQQRLFNCPCHEGRFDERGNVVSGLPLRPLTRFQSGSIRGELYVSRGNEHVRVKDDPVRTAQRDLLGGTERTVPAHINFSHYLGAMAFALLLLETRPASS